LEDNGISLSSLYDTGNLHRTGNGPLLMDNVVRFSDVFELLKMQLVYFPSQKVKKSMTLVTFKGETRMVRFFLRTSIMLHLYRLT